MGDTLWTRAREGIDTDCPVLVAAAGADASAEKTGITTNFSASHTAVGVGAALRGHSRYFAEEWPLAPIWLR